MNLRSSLTLLCLVLSLFACNEPLDLDKLQQICLPNDPKCANEDFDGDGVINADDDFPSDPDCTARSNDSCTACGVACAESERCDDTGECIPRDSEVCDGQDNDGDGQVDEDVADLAPLADKQDGVCSQSQQVCSNGEWTDPDYSSVEGYEAEESTCDGIDSDCDGTVDEALEAPLSDRQQGVCAQSIKRCLGAEGWAEPIYAELEAYELEEGLCDGRDNDCDGTADESASLSATAPLATVQDGLCAGTKQICDAGSWQEPPRSSIEGYEATETACDGIDSDCDGSVDENINTPLATNQIGVCANSRQVCANGTLQEPDPTTIAGYEATETACDGSDSDCDGSVDESLTAPFTNVQEGVCSGAVQVCSGENGWAEPNYSLIEDYEASETTCDGIDSDCDGSVDENVNTPLATNQAGVCASSRQVCANGSLQEPDPITIAGYEANETACDDIDSDCDGSVDEALTPPVANVQEGVCNGSVQVCSGESGWTEPNYSQIEGYEASETACDGIDSDCDGTVDENVNTPLATNQTGVCASSRQVCANGTLQEPNPTTIAGYEANETACDGIDSDCDGSIDEGLTPPLANVQEGVCSGAVQVCDNGEWVEPNYSQTPDYEAEEYNCDNVDNDCDGSVDEGLNFFQTTCGNGICQRVGLGQCNQGVLTDDCTPGQPQSYDDCNGVDDDCDGQVDEGEGPLASRQDGVCAQARRICATERGGWVEPDYNQIASYQDSEASCDGLDNDCDGEIDEAAVNIPAPLSARQAGVCEGVQRICFSGQYIEPLYAELGIGYEASEATCDGLDNDCDSAIDESLTPPLSTRQEGVCANSLSVCSGAQGWQDPDYAVLIPSYELAETSCDGVDSDCDGQVDENLSAPLAARQVGVCAGSVRICGGVNGWQEPDYSVVINTYEANEQSCDGLDNDCDSAVDEGLVPPLADLQDGVCAGMRKASCDGVNGWLEPDYSSVLVSYNEVDVLCDNQDNDCDGAIDEGGVERCRDGVDNDCDGTIDEPECSAFCGDGFADLEGGEECDDGNLIDGDDCDLDCLIEECGNSRMESNESCDDGNTETEQCEYGEESCTVCSATCTDVAGEVVGFCGDGEVNGPEQCDDGNTETEQCEYGECTVCSATCTEVAGEVVGFCGDGEVNGPEQCDGESWCGADCSGSPPPCASSAGGCPDLDFVTIQGGTFQMGSNSGSSNELPIHSVTLGSFEMMRSEITVGQYRLCVNASVCSSPSTGGSCNWSSSAGSKEDHPINCVSWRQFMEFTAWIGARLPTEAEWEYAARGEGQSITYPWGNGSPNCTLVAYNSCNSGTSTVCSHPTGNTDQGLCDMAGNVWEWVQDEYHSNYNGAPNDGSGWCTGSCPENASDSAYNASDSASRVIRGGGWSFSSSYMRSAARSSSSPSNQSYYLGARLSRSIP